MNHIYVVSIIEMLLVLYDIIKPSNNEHKLISSQICTEYFRVEHFFNKLIC